MKHRRLSALLAAGMMLSAISALPQSTAILLRPAITASAATGGTCGEHVTWELANGVLTISGTGEMTDYTLEERPFSGLSFTKAVISDGVTSIGDYTFMRCFGLKSVSIADSVKRFGKQAFYQCTALTDLPIPDSVTDIGLDVFNETPWLEAKQNEDPLVIVNSILVDGRTCTGEVTIPDGVTRIGEYAFYLAKTMTDVHIPSSVTSIAAGAFSGCWELKSVTVPNGVTAIEGAAFARCGALTSVKIPNSVTSIGASSFFSCTSLKSVILPDSVTSIGVTAFEDCTALESITIPAGVSDISEWAFVNCKKLTIKGYSGSYAETYAAEKEIPFSSLGSVPETGGQSGKCGENLTWTLKDGVLTVSGEGAMEDYTSFTKPFADLEFTKAVISDGVTSIGAYAFYECETLTELTIADSVTSIGARACSNCAALTDTAIPENVTGIGSLAFSRTPWLETKKQENPLVVVNGLLLDGAACSGDVVIPDGVTAILDAAFSFNTRVTGVSIPDSVTDIFSSAFYECVNLAEISIPESVTNIGVLAFEKTAWLKAQQEKDPLVAVNGILINGQTASGEAVIPDSVERILSSAFQGNVNLTRITIPACVTEIGDLAFYGCDHLTIRGYAGSAAEAHALEKNIPFERIGQEPVIGDCNGDGAVTVADAVLLARFAVEDTTLTDDQIAGILNYDPDFDGDGIVTISDAAAILRQLANGQLS